MEANLFGNGSELVFYIFFFFFLFPGWHKYIVSKYCYTIKKIQLTRIKIIQM